MADTDSMEPFRALSPAAMSAQTLTPETPFRVPPPLMISVVVRAGPDLSCVHAGTRAYCVHRHCVVHDLEPAARYGGKTMQGKQAYQEIH